MLLCTVRTPSILASISADSSTAVTAYPSLVNRSVTRPAPQPSSRQARRRWHRGSDDLRLDPPPGAAVEIDRAPVRGDRAWPGPGVTSSAHGSSLTRCPIRRFPSGTPDEVEMYLRWLAFLRGAVLRKASGITEEQSPLAAGRQAASR